MNSAVTALLAAVLLAGGGTVGCTAGGAADAKARTAPTSTDTGYTAADCKELMELNLEADAASDVSGEPRCIDLTRDEYVKLVGEVLAEHKDEILADAADKAIYDDAWNGLDAENQSYTCGLLREEGSETVGTILDALVDDPSIDTKAMAKYFFMEKC
ncbi:hypothetical protein ACFXAW_37690 [Streptomyces sp. NPDC059445]|uniref:hypothetical protein n=1 Tax=Streptomyces sp. NPDC059445 TaxID=3346832 RepID=UPI0036A83D7E